MPFSCAMIGTPSTRLARDRAILVGRRRLQPSRLAEADRLGSMGTDARAAGRSRAVLRLAPVATVLAIGRVR